MMKTRTKFFLTILIGIFAIVCQEYVRRYFNINPQFWVFVVYAMAMAGGYLIICAFCKELNKTQLLERMLRMTKSSDFIAFFNEDYSVEEERNKVKRVIKKVFKSHIYEEVNFIMTTFLCFLIIYVLFFWKYFFWQSKIISIVWFWIAMEDFACAIIYTNKVKKISNLFAGICAVGIVLLFF